MAIARRSSFLGALIGAVIFFIVVLGGIELGIAWLYLESEGVYDPEFFQLVETVAEKLGELDPEFAYADPLTLVLGQLLLSAVALALYFLPTVNARRRSHSHGIAIFVVNLMFGWTGIGWLAALLWSSLGGTPAGSVQKEHSDESWREHLEAPKKPARKTSASPSRQQSPAQQHSLETVLADRKPAVKVRDRGPTIQRR